MKTADPDGRSPAQRSERRAQLERLLLACAGLTTTALTLGTRIDPKLPPFKGE